MTAFFFVFEMASRLAFISAEPHMPSAPTPARDSAPPLLALRRGATGSFYTGANYSGKPSPPFADQIAFCAARA